MNQQPDKLFNEKLRELQRPVPASAWSRVEKNLDKKNDRALWLKIAASFLIVGTAAFLFWPSEQKTTPRNLATLDEKTAPRTEPRTNTTEKPKTDSSAVENAEPIKRSTTTTSGAAREKRTAVKRSGASRKQNDVIRNEERNDASKKKDNSTPPVRNERNDAMPLDHLASTHAPENNVNEPALAEKKDLTENAVAAQQPAQRMRIVYTVEEVDEKYLDKKALAEATSDDPKPSTFRKLLDKAYDLKHNQDPFGDLRQRKNEILALNFKSEKQRSQNK